MDVGARYRDSTVGVISVAIFPDLRARSARILALEHKKYSTATNCWLLGVIAKERNQSSIYFYFTGRHKYEQRRRY